MVSIKFLFFLAAAIACVAAFPEDGPREKKQVYYGAYPYSYTGYNAAPLAYSAGYSAYSSYPRYSAYSAYTGYPYYY